MSKEATRIKLIKEWIDERKDVLQEESTQLYQSALEKGEETTEADAMFEQVNLLEELWNFIESLERS